MKQSEVDADAVLLLVVQLLFFPPKLSSPNTHRQQHISYNFSLFRYALFFIISIASTMSKPLKSMAKYSCGVPIYFPLQPHCVWNRSMNVWTVLNWWYFRHFCSVLSLRTSTKDTHTQSVHTILVQQNSVIGNFHHQCIWIIDVNRRHVYLVHIAHFSSITLESNVYICGKMCCHCIRMLWFIQRYAALL